MAVAFLVVGIVLHSAALVFVSNIDYENSRPVIYDIVHEHIHVSEWPTTARTAVDLLKNALPVLVVGYSLYVTFVRASDSSLLLSVLLQTWAWLLVAKAIMCTVTVLPSPAATRHACVKEFRPSDFVFGKCCDLIFSLHTALVLGTCLVLHHYAFIDLMTTISLTFATAALMIVTQAHYTIDAIVGCFVACCVVHVVLLMTPV